MPSATPIAILAAALSACTTVDLPPDQEPAPERYTVTAITPTERGVLIVEAIAACDEGDEVIGGGCVWGASEDPADLPLYPVVDAPDGVEGWRCRGRNGGVGTTLEPVVATAICEARS